MTGLDVSTHAQVYIKSGKKNLVRKVPRPLGPKGLGTFRTWLFSVDFMYAFARLQTSRPVILVLGWYSDGNTGFGGFGLDCNHPIVILRPGAAGKKKMRICKVLRNL